MPRTRNPVHRAKAEAFWARLAAQRQRPGHCGRCGRPHAGALRQCDPCRAKVSRAKQLRQLRGMQLAECVAMVRQCRREVSKLREIIKQMKRHYEYRRARQHRARRTLRKYADAYPVISKQEAAGFCHAYDHDA